MSLGKMMQHLLQRLKICLGRMYESWSLSHNKSTRFDFDKNDM